MKFGKSFFCFSVIALVASAQINLSAAATSGSDSLRVAGLKESVEILKDRWGISHIYAKNESDLFFAQARRNSGGTLAIVSSCFGATLPRN
jgi:acyl-homoserine lactone acylase PvdQ